MGLDAASHKNRYSAGLGFCAGPAAGFWMEGLGPGNSTFYYGPAPASAAHAVLTARGYPPLIVPTRPLAREGGLPRGRFFVADPPGPPSVAWDVKLEDATGHEVPFANF
jgi:hypothetical protein